MKKLLLLSLVFTVSSLASTNHAQVGNYLKKKAKQATVRAGQKADDEVSDEMNKKVDNEVGKVFNKIFGADSANSTTTTPQNTDNQNNNSSSQTSNTSSQSGRESSAGNQNADAMQNSMLKAMGISTVPANISDSYSFDSNILMNIQSWDDDGDTDGATDYYNYYTKNNSGFAIKFEQPEKGTSIMIFDIEGENMIVLTDDGNEKAGMVTNYSGVSEEDFDVEEEINGEDIDDYSVYNENLKKTGRTKNIAGYKCEEYVYEDDQLKSELWLTDDISSKYWTNFSGANVFSGGMAGYYGGFVMEMNQVEKNSKNRVYLIVKEVNMNKSTSISTKGYELFSIGVNPDNE